MHSNQTVKRIGDRLQLRALIFTLLISGLEGRISIPCICAREKRRGPSLLSLQSCTSRHRGSSFAGQSQEDLRFVTESHCNSYSLCKDTLVSFQTWTSLVILWRLVAARCGESFSTSSLAQTSWKVINV